MSYKFFIILAVAFSLATPARAGLLCILLSTDQQSRGTLVEHTFTYTRLPYGDKVCYADGDELEFIKDNFDGIRKLHHQVNPAQDDTIWTGDDAEFINENL